MHAIKVGWIGQTFALAKSNESEARKARIRRSKEERKSMAESFIKTYQKLNNGNFPSLNLTHKEVGGSFYTVREIVREIIQENRVLGPAKLNTDEQRADQFLEQSPLGSISTEPQLLSSLPSNSTEELVLNFYGQYTIPVSEHQQLHNNLKVNGSQPDKINEECDELISKELPVAQVLKTVDKVAEEPHASMYKASQLSEVLETDINAVAESEAVPSEASRIAEALETDENIVDKSETSTTLVSQITADVVVETFPLRPVLEPVKNLGRISEEVGNLTGTVEEREPEIVKNISTMVDEKPEANHEDQCSETNSVDANVEALLNIENKSLENLRPSKTKEGIMAGDKDNSNLDIAVSYTNVITANTFEDSQGTAATKPMIAPNGMSSKNLIGSKTSGKKDSKPSEKEVVQNKVDDQPRGGCQKESKPTLDRINLSESWDRTSKNLAEQETNPLLAFFKAFVTAFQKFWSE